MRFALLLMLCAMGAPARAQTPARGNPLNPDISAIGFFLAAGGNGSKEPRALNLKEVELGFQSVVDPYARADFFVSASPEAVEVEEGYITWLALPGGLQARAGRFRLDFGKFNRIHGPETPFADRPLAAEAFLGDDGLNQAAAHLSWIMPNPLDLFVQWDFEAANGPSADESPAFDRAFNRDLLYLARGSLYTDFSRAHNANLGVSFARGPSGSTIDAASASSSTLHSDLVGLDLTFRWKPPSRNDRSLIWQTEWYWANRETVDPANPAGKFHAYPWGLFTYVDWQFAKRWHAGARYDYTKLVSNAQRRQGELAFMTFTPTEFSLLSLQGKHVVNEDDREEWAVFFKVTFNIGPHGAHPF